MNDTHQNLFYCDEFQLIFFHFTWGVYAKIVFLTHKSKKISFKSYENDRFESLILNLSQFL